MQESEKLALARAGAEAIREIKESYSADKAELLFALERTAWPTMACQAQ